MAPQHSQGITTSSGRRRAFQSSCMSRRWDSTRVLLGDESLESLAQDLGDRDVLLGGLDLGSTQQVARQLEAAARQIRRRLFLGMSSTGADELIGRLGLRRFLEGCHADAVMRLCGLQLCQYAQA